MSSFVERAVAQASGFKFARVALTVLAAPFYVLGFLAGVVVVVAVLAFGALRLGIADVRARLDPPAPDSTPMPGDGDD